MEKLLGLVLLLFVIALLVRFPHQVRDFFAGLKRGEGTTAQDERLPYRSRRYLLSKTEAAFFHSLRRVVQDQYVLSMKVRLADVLKCSSEGWREGYGNKIVQKHLDFVLCDPRTVEIVAAIELDDASHQRHDRIDRDSFLDSAMKSAGIPLIRIKAAMQYNIDDLALELRNQLSPRTASAVQPRRATSV